MILIHQMGFASIGIALVLPIALLFQATASQPPSAAETDGGQQNEELLRRIWDGVQRAQDEYSTGCGRLTETRTSPLLERPLVLRGDFCAAGTEKFALRYVEPSPLSVTFNEDYLNVSTGSDVRNTDVFKIGHHVRRTQGYFTREQSIDNLKDNFVIVAEETEKHYTMKLVPRTKRFEKRVNYIVVTLDKENCLPRSLEVDGKSGVHSRFDIEITDLNTTLDEETFRVYRPQ